MIRVVDNGRGKLSDAEPAIQDLNANIQSSGLGTQLANNLAKQLGGTFRRYQNVPKGTVCELSWSAKRRWFW